jgi:uncharacterized protein
MPEDTIPRSDYLQQLEDYRKNRDLIKVITGVRRCGKSVLIKQFRERLEAEGEQVIYIDLEEKRFVIDSDRMLYQYIESEIESSEPYLLIDEVQIVPGWEKAVNAIRTKHNANVYITGSNAQILSSELSTLIAGRYVEIGILPFSFTEFVRRYPISGDIGYTQRFEQYLRWGGMPIIDLDDDEPKNRAILSSVYDSIVNKDIRTHMSLEQGILENMTAFMMSNIGNPVSSNAISKGAIIGDQRTVERYLTQLHKCYIFYRADKYDILGKKHLRTNAKFYAVDTGLRNSILYGQEYNEAALLENAVYLELIRRGYKVSVGSYKDAEVDFTAWKDDVPEFYQVVLIMSSVRTKDREYKAFRSMAADNRCIILTMDRDYSNVPEGVKVLNVIDWMLEDRGDDP